MPVKLPSDFFITLIFTPMCKLNATAATEFKTLWCPIRFTFIFLIILFFAPGTEILRFYNE